MDAFFNFFNFWPNSKRQIATAAAMIVGIIQLWNSSVPEFGHGPCLATAGQIADALNAASTCASDWTLKIPDTINALIVAFLGVGVVVGKTNDKAEIMSQVKPAAQTAAFKETQ